MIFYLARERGNEVRRDIARDVDDLLYRVFQDVTFSMAIKYELANRIDGQDSRRILFDEQKRLLGILNEDWKTRRHKNIEENLSQSSI